jgi:hypothetical protein
LDKVGIVFRNRRRLRQAALLAAKKLMGEQLHSNILVSQDALKTPVSQP